MLDLLYDLLSQMQLNVIGLDNPKADEAYGRLRDAIEDFTSQVSFNLFINPEHTVLEKSPDWTWEQWKKASEEINEACKILVQRYNEFLQICHKSQLD